MKKPVSLARYMSIGNMYLIILPLLIAGSWGLFIFDKAIRASVTASNEASATIVAGRLEEFFERPTEALNGIRYILDREDLYSREKIEQFLETERGIYPFLDQIQVIGSDGRLKWMAPSNPSMQGISKIGDEVYEGVLHSSGIYWSPSYISLKKDRVSLSFGMRSKEYTILCDLDFGAMGRFTNLEHQGPGLSPIEIRITDKNGVFVSHSDSKRVLLRERQNDFLRIKEAKNSSNMTGITENGKTYLVSMAQFKGPAWYVLVLYPSSLLILSLSGYYIGVAIIIALSVGFGLLFSILRVRRLRAGLNHITDTTGSIAEGRYENYSLIGEDFIEFRSIAESFDKMVAEIKNREDLLLDRERGFREILENIGLIALRIDLHGDVVFANRYFLNLSGYEWTDIAGGDLSRFMMAGYTVAESPFARIIRGESTEEELECQMKMKDLSPRIIQWTIIGNRDARGALSGATGIGIDITETRQQRIIIEASLREKEILLKEVHHRVKNNLQLITSLLALQEHEIDNQIAMDALIEAQTRIRSLSLIHEMLYDSNDFGDMDFKEYASNLANELLLLSNPDHIEVQLDLEPIRLTLIEAIPCGLILNEALTNIRKYAFPKTWVGERRVELSASFDDSDWVQLVIRDNGQGLPEGYDPEKSESLGHTIMRLLAIQLKGTLQLINSHGLCIELRFPRSHTV